MRRLLPLLLAACPEAPTLPPHPCHSDATAVDVTPAREPFGAMGDGTELWSGIPPQGGAPYTPLRTRVLGPEVLFDGMVLELVVEDDRTGEELSYSESQTRMTCANVGESAGYWVGSEIHLRYPGYSLEALEGRDATLTVRVTSLDDTVSIEGQWSVGLVVE